MDSLEDRRLAEKEVLTYMLEEVYPSGIYSHVSDSYDYWYTINHTVRELKDLIIERQQDNEMTKLVLRPDSGDPEKIICGLKIKDLMPYISNKKDIGTNMLELLNFAKYHINTEFYDGFYYEGISYNWQGENLEDEIVKGSLEILWDIFGGEINDKGYKVLHPAIGLIYGDSITIQRAESILKRMKEMKFASSNIVFGTGSYGYQLNTRDSLGFAMKATYGEVNKKEIQVFKDPKTDSGTKKSAKGLLTVSMNDYNEYHLIDQCTKKEEQQGCLKTVFKDGVLTRETSLEEIRKKIDSEFKDLTL